MTHSDVHPESHPGGGSALAVSAAESILGGHPDTEALCAELAEAAAKICDRLVLVLLFEPAGGVRASRVWHPDERRAVVLQARLTAELRALPPAGGPVLPVDAAALPEPVRAVIEEELGHPRSLLSGARTAVVVVPVSGVLAPVGVLVLVRPELPPFTASEVDHVVELGAHFGHQLELARLAADSYHARSLMAVLPDAVITVDDGDIVTQWNAAAERLYRIRAAEAVGSRLHDLVRTVFRETDAHSVHARVRSEGQWSGRVRQTSRSGQVVDCDVRLVPLTTPQGRSRGRLGVYRLAPPAAAPRAGDDTGGLADLVHALDSPAALLDGSGRVINANRHWRQAVADIPRGGCAPVPEGASWTAALRAAPVPEARALAGAIHHLLEVQEGAHHVECHCGPADLGPINIHVAATGRGGALVTMLAPRAVLSAIPDELTHRATHDELTGLPNRAKLMDDLSLSLNRLDGTGKLAVLFCDLDGFKDINDGLGHAVGDQVLIAVAKRLRQRCRSADVVARFGGDEFVVVLSINEAAQAIAMADRIVEVLAEPIVVGEAEVAPGVSVGITVVDVPPDDENPVGTLLRDADTAMYHAKGRGRGRYELFDASLRENIEERLELAAALHRAVPDGQLEIAYQSRRHCGDRRVAGVEAMLRWRHPVLGLLEPDLFIPIAERTGRIVELGEWILQNALADLAALDDQRITLAVNVSPRQLAGGRLAHAVAESLAATGVDPSRLTLEITESAFVDDPDVARTVLTDLRNLGISIALDDFGTGWSSLQYLRTLPVDVLKIDRSFVADLPTDLDACAVVAAVLQLGHGMGLVVVAEGVENLDHLNVLRDMGCDEYQGFIDGRPGPLVSVLAPSPPTTQSTVPTRR